MKTVLLRLARSTFGSRLLRLLLQAAPGLLPGKKYYRSKTLIAFRHPVPAYPLHVLLVPLPTIPGPSALQNEHAPLIREVWNTANHIALSMALPAGWRLVVNGGDYQDVHLLHFHLIAETLT